MKKIIIFICLLIVLFIANKAYAELLYGVNNAQVVIAYDVATGSPVNSFSTSFAGGYRLTFGPDGYLYGVNSAMVFVHQQVEIRW